MEVAAVAAAAAAAAAADTDVTEDDDGGVEDMKADDGSGASRLRLEDMLQKGGTGRKGIKWEMVTILLGCHSPSFT